MFNTEKCKAAAMPRHRLDDKEVDRESATLLLDLEASLQCPCGTMRAAYFAVDCPESSETVKVLAQAVSKPNKGHVGLLNRLVRYLAG